MSSGKIFLLLLTLLSGFLLCAAKPSVIIKGIVYRHAGVVARELGTGYFRSGQSFFFARGKNTFSFRAERADFRFNNMKIAGNFPVRRLGDTLYFSAVDVNTVLKPLFVTSRSALNHRIRKIIIDPGHGGFDRGASGRICVEKITVLKLAHRVAEILKRCGYTVFLTRKTDYLIPLNSRCVIANNQRGDIFVSLHCNASTDRRANRVETYCLTPAGAASTNQKKRSAVKFPGNRFDANNFLLACEIQRAVLARSRANDRSVRHGRFAVLRNLNMPGVLLELGFISNPAEEKKLASLQYQEQLARGIAVGIINYHRRLYGKR